MPGHVLLLLHDVPICIRAIIRGSLSLLKGADFKWRALSRYAIWQRFDSKRKKENATFKIKLYIVNAELLNWQSETVLIKGSSEIKQSLFFAV